MHFQPSSFKKMKKHSSKINIGKENWKKKEHEEDDGKNPKSQGEKNKNDVSYNKKF